MLSAEGAALLPSRSRARSERWKPPPHQRRQEIGPLNPDRPEGRPDRFLGPVVPFHPFAARPAGRSRKLGLERLEQSFVRLRPAPRNLLADRRPESVQIRNPAALSSALIRGSERPNSPVSPPAPDERKAAAPAGYGWLITALRNAPAEPAGSRRSSATPASFQPENSSVRITSLRDRKRAHRGQGPSSGIRRHLQNPGVVSS